MPIADEPQMEAAVVSPRTFMPLWTMMPAPRNPMPVRMLPMTRVGSPPPPPCAVPQYPSDGSPPSSVTAQDVAHTRQYTWLPAARPLKCRSYPTDHPSTKAHGMGATIHS